MTNTIVTRTPVFFLLRICNPQRPNMDGSIVQREILPHRRRCFGLFRPRPLPTRRPRQRCPMQLHARVAHAGLQVRWSGSRLSPVALCTAEQHRRINLLPLFLFPFFPQCAWLPQRMFRARHLRHGCLHVRRQAHWARLRPRNLPQPMLRPRHLFHPPRTQRTRPHRIPPLHHPVQYW